MRSPFTISLILLFLIPIAGNSQACPYWKQVDNIDDQNVFTVITTATNTQGETFVAGKVQVDAVIGNSYFDVTPTIKPYFIAKLDTNRNWVWIKQLITTDFSSPGGSTPFERPKILSISENNDLLVSGRFRDSVKYSIDTTLYASPTAGSTLNRYNAFIGSIDAQTGSLKYMAQLQSYSSFDVTSIAGDANGETFVSGLMAPVAGANDTLYTQNTKLDSMSGDSYLGKINTQGNWVWIQRLANNSVAPKLLIDNQDLWVSTLYKESFQFAGQTIPNTPYSYDLFLGRFAKSGNGLSYGRVVSQRIFGAQVHHLDIDDNGKLHTVVTGVGIFNLNGTHLLDNKVNHLSYTPASATWQFVNKLDFDNYIPTFKVDVDEKGSLTIGVQGIVEMDSFSVAAFNPQPRNFFGRYDSTGSWEWGGYIHPSGGSSPGIVELKATADAVYTTIECISNTVIGNFQSGQAASVLATLVVDSVLNLRNQADTILACRESFIPRPYFSSLGASSFKWSPSYGLDNDTIAYPTIDPGTDTRYTVEVTTNAGCTDTMSFLVERDSLPWYGPGINFTSSTGSFTFCEGDEITIGTSLPYLIHNWSNGETGSTITVNEPGSYYLVARTRDGCYSYDTVHIEPFGQIVADPPMLCHGDTLTLSVDNPDIDSFDWSTGEKSKTIDVYQPGVYSVTISNDTCSYTDEITIDYLNDTANADFTYWFKGFTTTFYPKSPGVDTAYWTFGDGNSSTQKIPTHTYTAVGNYNVCFTNIDICGYEETYCQTVYVDGLSEPELKAPPRLKLYPNPAADFITLSSPEIQEINLKVYDLRGQLMISRKLLRGNRWEIPVRDLPSGFYQVLAGGQSFRFIKR